jgi:8-oxo-dGTP diphosphatase
MNQPDLTDIIQHLLKDEITNMSIIGFVSENPITAILREGNSVLIKGISDEEWMYIFSKDEKELRNLLDLLNRERYFFRIC